MIQHRGLIPEAAEVRLSPEDRAVLEARLRAPTTEQRHVLRARIILLAADGRSMWSIVRTVGTMPRTVNLWRGRFARDGSAGLTDKPRLGPTPKYGAETGRRILAVLDKPPTAGSCRRGPRGLTRWRSDSRSCRASLCTVRPLPLSSSFASTSRPTMRTLRPEQNRGPPMPRQRSPRQPIVIPGTRDCVLSGSCATHAR